MWQTGLPNSVIGSPSLNGGGVIAVGTYDFTATPNAVYVINAANGQKTGHALHRGHGLRAARLRQRRPLPGQRGQGAQGRSPDDAPGRDAMVRPDLALGRSPSMT